MCEKLQVKYWHRNGVPKIGGGRLQPLPSQQSTKCVTRQPQLITIHAKNIIDSVRRNAIYSQSDGVWCMMANPPSVAAWQHSTGSPVCRSVYYLLVIVLSDVVKYIRISEIQNKANKKVKPHMPHRAERFAEQMGQKNGKIEKNRHHAVVCCRSICDLYTHSGQLHYMYLFGAHSRTIPIVCSAYIRGAIRPYDSHSAVIAPKTTKYLLNSLWTWTHYYGISTWPKNFGDPEMMCSLLVIPSFVYSFYIQQPKETIDIHLFVVWRYRRFV